MTRRGEPTTLEIAGAIEQLRDLLFREYGADGYSFVVVGKSSILGSATSLVQGAMDHVAVYEAVYRGK